MIIEKRLRKSYGKIDGRYPIPNLIELQKVSYDAFLQKDVPPAERKSEGLQAIFESVFPIIEYDENASLEFSGYEIGEPKYEVRECRDRGVNYAAPIKVHLRLVVWDNEEADKPKEIQSIKEQDIYLGDIPLMTDNGSFVINGAERVVVSQMHRSPGVFFDHDRGRTHSSGKLLYSARIIPYRGSWLDFEFCPKDIIHFRIDRKRKLPVTTLLRAIGMDSEKIFHTFYDPIDMKAVGDNKYRSKLDLKIYRNTNLNFDIVDADTGEVLFAEGTRITPRIIKQYQKESPRDYYVNRDEVIGRFVSQDIINDDTGEIILEIGDEITPEALDLMEEFEIKEFKVLDVDYIRKGPYLRNTYIIDRNKTREAALAEIYKVIRPGEPSTPEVAEEAFHNIFFDEVRYDLTVIGRMKLNTKHKLNIDENYTVLTPEDIISVVKHMVSLRDGFEKIDDIDNLSNRRVRSVGESIANQFRIGLVRMERFAVEKINSKSKAELDKLMPHDIVNSKPITAVIKEFFGSSQLSQFDDQTNPLSEITHKRRISALGPGGLSRERAGFEVRDVHPSHYGRICPIETPEGPNIGLISSLSTYARINKYGFIETPVRKVTEGVVSSEIKYLAAMEESDLYIASSEADISENGEIVEDVISGRRNGEYITFSKHQADYMEIDPKQLVSVAASLIPFLENDDANRALMGSNMQRQAVPLIKSEAPLVGTGMEKYVARDSGAVIKAKRPGVVEFVDANRIVVKYVSKSNDGAPGVDIYTLDKYIKSNQNTCINQVPIVRLGDRIEEGEIIADGPSTDMGELALGRNVLVAFMPWNGLNYEDSILISEKIVHEDTFRSDHIQVFELVVRDTRLGPEELTREIPNVGEENVTQLDEIGIIHVGSEVKTGDILVGKVTPKTESPATPEEKLLRAIFGEKAADVRDSSLRVPPGVKGVVIDVKLYTRRGVEKDDRARALQAQEITILSKDRDEEIRIIEDYVYSSVYNILENRVVETGIKEAAAGEELTKEKLLEIAKRNIWKITVTEEKINNQLSDLKEFYETHKTRIEERYKQRIAKVQSGDDLPQGALKVVKVYVAHKQQIEPGDKMAGRHGNKGIVSKIVPIEDMPYLEDGTPVEIVLSPLGVPSRMNVGQILETHLGWASRAMGQKIKAALKEYLNNKMKLEELRSLIVGFYDGDINAGIRAKLEKMNSKQLVETAMSLQKGVPIATPVFDGAKIEDIDLALESLGQDKSGQVYLYNGKTGERFDRKVTVGYIYMLKLDHLVNDKIHARSIGPYSLVTQQPLGGKSHFGGQRFGEMECWALQAYGAAYTLQEMLTVKSDDVSGRVRIYESIVRGDNAFDSGLPESFNVMLKELLSLCLNVELRHNDEAA